MPAKQQHDTSNEEFTYTGNLKWGERKKKQNWDDLNEVYIPLEENTKEGDFLEIQVDTVDQLGELNVQLLRPFISSWTFPNNGKYIKPFRLLDFAEELNSIRAQIQLVKKVKDIDELRLRCQDLLAFLNSDQVRVSNFSVRIYS